MAVYQLSTELKGHNAIVVISFNVDSVSVELFGRHFVDADDTGAARQFADIGFDARYVTGANQMPDELGNLFIIHFLIP
ncbi:hypothetical protein PLUA15_20120 [Pseudomonas lundensis]|uniref:Uncharacterized protein n=1 Tax=Pseudomonas lundensis TaxID=86185 RepID=A0AAX2H5M8_9PSED|nr:hypothetical protein PLUA15_20120 [Pseudomonas lundensis]